MAAVEVWCTVNVVGPEGVTLSTWTLAGPGSPDLAVVDDLARLHLSAGREGATLVVREASLELRRLLDLAGLGTVIGRCDVEAPPPEPGVPRPREPTGPHPP